MASSSAKRSREATEAEPGPEVLRWAGDGPGRVLIVCKDGDDEVDRVASEVREHVRTELGLDVADGADDGKIDLVVSIGGDGTLLSVGRLFQGLCPPVVAFNMGTLGFLTPFRPDSWRETLAKVVRGGMPLCNRHRLACRVGKDGAVSVATNEVVLDRGPAPHLLKLDCACDGTFFTVAVADGVIVSTPTGSTAYNLSAGGPMLHPSLPAVVMTPICPHSLSFRPLVFGRNAELQLTCREDSRAEKVQVTIDGGTRLELRRGQTLHVTTHEHPLPCVTDECPTSDWAAAVTGLGWNARPSKRSRAPQRPSL